MSGDDTFVDESILKKVPRWRNYLAAKLGFRNHWYPIRFSRDVDEAQVLKAKLLGEDILLKRVDGKVYAIKDRCIHRGVPLSEKIECYTKGTITCWYHGFTYKWQTGELCDIIAVPNSPMIGKAGVKSYPVEEAKGLIFVFVGDDDYDVPPLATDVPPWFLDDDMYVEGYAYPVNSNWRVAAENGFDALHIYIHRESPLVPNTQRSLPLGNVRTEFKHFFLEDDDGPKGLGDSIVDNVASYEGRVEGEIVVRGTKMHSSPEEAKKKRTTGTVMCLPGVLRVDNFPFSGITQFEWYVPVTEDSHLYLITLGKRCANSEEQQNFSHEFWHRWKSVSLEGFNDQDVMAREALQKFYKTDEHWLEERLVREDKALVMWRELCHKHGRALQLPKHVA